MNIIAHRGLWSDLSQKNRSSSLIEAIKKGFGVELDIRTFNGVIKISHEPASALSDDLEVFLEQYASFGSDLHIAINIKEDGLHSRLRPLLNKYSIENYFVFDMSFPDAYKFLQDNYIVYDRVSDFESGQFLMLAEGVWLDCFEENWLGLSRLKVLLEKYSVCLVSPELHGFEYEKCWQEILGCDSVVNSKKFSICTDYPLEFLNYMSGVEL